jgi:hypothetical protein
MGMVKLEEAELRVGEEYFKCQMDVHLQQPMCASKEEGEKEAATSHRH